MGYPRSRGAWEGLNRYRHPRSTVKYRFRRALKRRVRREQERQLERDER